jgi:hypothetical protein
LLIFANIFLAFWWCTCTGPRPRPLPPWRSHFLNLIHYDYTNCLAAIFYWLHPFLRKAPSSVVHPIFIELELSFFTHLASIFGGWFCGWKRWPTAGHDRGRMIGSFCGCDSPKADQLTSLQSLGVCHKTTCIQSLGVCREAAGILLLGVCCKNIWYNIPLITLVGVWPDGLSPLEKLGHPRPEI